MLYTLDLDGPATCDASKSDCSLQYVFTPNMFLNLVFIFININILRPRYWYELSLPSRYLRDMLLLIMKTFSCLKIFYLNEKLLHIILIKTGN